MLSFCKQTPTTAFRRLERDLSVVSPRLNLAPFKSMMPGRLEEEIGRLEHQEKKMIRERLYGSWLHDERFVEMKLLREALECLLEYKADRMDKEVLVAGFTYYRGMKRFGPTLVGRKCLYLGESDWNRRWVPFKQNAAVMKAFEVLRHGSPSDFREIYVGLADGRVDGLSKVCIEHVTDSSPATLRLIEKFCDSRWSGPWPWETPAPYKIKHKIEVKENMINQQITEMQGRFRALLQALNEDDMGKFEIIQQLKEMEKKIQGMVEDLGQMMGEGLMTLKDNARTVMGDQVAQQIEMSLTNPVNQAADMLSKLRAAIAKTTGNIDQGQNDMAGGDLGTPAGAMGQDPNSGGPAAGGAGDDGLSTDLSDVSLDGNDGERPMKGM